jgi:putative salt-induced outer membrane protein YdiY
LFGEVEFRWPLFDRMEVEHKSTINPSVEDFQIFRVVSNYGISLRLDESAKWNFKLGLRHEYNSKPNNNREKSDYTTNILLVYSRK